MIESYGGGNSGGWLGLKKAEPTHGWDNELWMRLLLLFSLVSVLLWWASVRPHLALRLIHFHFLSLRILLNDPGKYLYIVPIDSSYTVWSRLPLVTICQSRRIFLWASRLLWWNLHVPVSERDVKAWSSDFLIFKRISYYFGDAPLFQMNRKNLSPLWHEEWSGRKSHFRGKEYNLSYFIAELLLSQTGILHHAVKLIWFPPAQRCELRPWISPQSGCR